MIKELSKISTLPTRKLIVDIRRILCTLKPQLRIVHSDLGTGQTFWDGLVFLRRDTALRVSMAFANE